MEKRIRNARTTIKGEVQALRQVERRLARLEAGRGAQGAPEATGAVKKPTARPPSRKYPELVTAEPEPGEEQVYGNAAPLIVEWRRVRSDFTDAGDRLSKLMAEERMLELEIEMIGEHELTLPPVKYPWDGFDRRHEVWDRTQELSRVRVKRNRALLRRWLRRVLTLGLWKK